MSEERFIKVDSETVTIFKKKYDYLKMQDLKLQTLEGWGVDNWCGYDEAMETLKNSEEYKELKKSLVE